VKALFTTAVWGQDYVERFLNFSLRTQLTAGNLGQFDRNSLFLLITDTKSMEYFRSSPIFEKLADLVSVEFVDLEQFRDGLTNKYSILTACQNYALERSVEYDAIFFGYGDAIWADGSYQAAATRLEQGYDAVFLFGYPVLDNAFKAAINDQIRDAPLTAQICISPRQLSRLIYQNLHPMAHANVWGSKTTNHCPSYIVWDVQDQGLLLRAFHLHPVVLRVQKSSPFFFTPFKSTLDEEFVSRLNRINPRIYVCQNSDELVACSMADTIDSEDDLTARRPATVNELAIFAETYAGLVHRQHFNRSIRLIATDVVESEWKPAEAEANAVSSDVMQLLSTPDSVLALENPTAFSARLQRQLNHRHWHKNDLNDLEIGITRKFKGDFSRTTQHSSPSMASILVAESFSRSFQSMTNASRSPSIGFARRLQLKSMKGAVSFLHATKVTHMVRIYVLPSLPKTMRMRLYEHAYRLGVIGHLPQFAPPDHGGLLVKLIGWVKKMLGSRS